MPEIIVIGGGVIGLTCASILQRSNLFGTGHHAGYARLHDFHGGGRDVVGDESDRQAAALG